MSNIPIRDITNTGIPSPSSLIVFDDGQMKKGLASSLADAIRPVASLGEAQTGTDNIKTMTALRVKQSLSSEVGVSIASKAQGDLANTSLQPGNIGGTVQGYDADLAAIAALAPADNDILQRKSGAWTSRTIAQVKTDLAYGTAAALNVGTAAGNVVQLNGAAKLPAIDGSQLTNLPAAGGGLLASNNLSDLGNVQAAKANLNVYDFNTRSAAAAATISAAQMLVRTGGYAVAGDKGNALYKKVVSLLAGVSGFQSADGAWWQISEHEIYPQMVGSISGSATSAINLAITTAQTLGGCVRLTGAYAISSAITITGNPVSIKGDGRHSTIIYPTTGINAISINTDSPVQLEDFSIQFGGTGNGAGVVVTGPYCNIYSKFTRLWVTNSPSNFVFTAAAYWIMDDCYLTTVGTAISIQNTANVDAGDSCISNCLITGTTTTNGIQWISSGGLKIANNKLLSHARGFYCTLAPGANTTGLYFSNNSFELISNEAFLFTRVGPTGTLQGVTIVGGEAVSVTFINVPSDANGVWLQGLVVSGQYWLSGTGGVFANIFSTNGFYIAGNVLVATAGSPYKAIIGSSAANGEVGPNPGVGTFTASGNASPSTTITRS